MCCADGESAAHGRARARANKVTEKQVQMKMSTINLARYYSYLEVCS